MAYVYKHIRKDNNQVFYVGIGADNKGKYSRAYSLRRNGFWHIIKNKTDYLVEIVYDNITWEEACEKEKQLIKEYFEKIFVISHNPLISNWADKIVKITKTENVSKVSQ